MAQAQVTVKMEPMELAVIQEALRVYLTGLRGDDSGTKLRRYTAQGVLTAIGMGLPETTNGTRQLSFVAEKVADDEPVIEATEPADDTATDEQPVAATGDDMPDWLKDEPVAEPA